MRKKSQKNPHQSLGGFRSKNPPSVTTGIVPKSNLGLNGVAVAQNGLILGQDGATAPDKVSGYLRGLPDTIYNF